MAATCPSCGGPLDETSDRCHRCGQATTRRYYTSGSAPVRKSAPPPPDISLPFSLADARFMAGEIWTHGLLYLTDLGVFLLAESDGPWTAERLAAILTRDPSKPSAVGPASQFLPLNRIVRFKHTRLTDFAIDTADGKRPLRLQPEGWKTMDSYAAKTGIPVS